MKKQNVNMLAGGGGPAEPVLSKAPAGCRTTKKLTKTVSQPTKLRGPVDPGFTMAEILLSLTIIGVVAAITLPSLTGNINERTWNTQRKALFARMTQAISLMPALNGYGKFTEETDSEGNTSVIEDTATETFITDGLAKVLKINNICDAEHLADCGITSKITTMYGSVTSLPLKLNDLGTYHDISGIKSTGVAAFETANGESIAVYYNPICLGNWKVDGRLRSYVGNDLCANFVFDLNGNKGPNTVGKDIGIMSVFYSSDSSVVMPIPLVRSPQGLPFDESKRVCKSLGDNLRQATLDEVGSIFINQPVVGSQVYDNYSDGVWGGDSLVEKGKNPYHINRFHGLRYNSFAAESHYGTVCIQR